MNLRYVDGDVFKKSVKVHLAFIAIGLVLIIIYINLDSYFKSQESPDLAKADSLSNDIVYSVKKEGTILYVEFESGKRRKIVGGRNFNYEEGLQSLSEVLSTDDLVSKKAGDDTLWVKHKSREFIFIPNHQIGN